jgi:hypothetical protein
MFFLILRGVQIIRKPSKHPKLVSGANFKHAPNPRNHTWNKKTGK